MDGEMTLKQWVAEHPPDESAFTQSIAGIADRHAAGEDFWIAMRELLDEFDLAPTEEIRQGAIFECPRPTGDLRYDAFLGALAEHLAVKNDLERPGWAVAHDRFLDRFWFVSEVPGFRAIAIAQSPAAFRRRGVMIASGFLHRV